MTTNADVGITPPNNDARKEWEEFCAREADFQKLMRQQEADAQNVGDDQDFRSILQRRSGVEYALRNARETREYKQAEIRNQGWIQFRREALTNPSAQKDLQKRLKNRQERLARFRTMTAPVRIIKNEERMVWKCSAPLEEVERFYVEKQETLQQEIGNLGERIQALQTALNSVNEQLRERKRYLKSLPEGTRKRIAAHREDLRVWAVQDTERLVAYIGSHPTERHELVAIYNAQHPTDQFLLSEPNNGKAAHQSPTTPHRHPERRRKSPGMNAQAIPLRETVNTLWQFELVGDSLGTLLLLPTNEQAAHHAIIDHFKKKGSNVGHLVYTALKRVITLSKIQRQTMHKLVDASPQGWKIAKAGRFRIFLDIHEETRHIRFLVRPRRDAYDKKRNAFH